MRTFHSMNRVLAPAVPASFFSVTLHDCTDIRIFTLVVSAFVAVSLDKQSRVRINNIVWHVPFWVNIKYMNSQHQQWKNLGFWFF